jgi:hypothetical protein
MDPRRRVLHGLSAFAVIATLSAATAHAQFYEDARRDLGLGPDPIARSPQNVGMGRLSLVVDDVHNRFDIWEFSANPAALVESDSVSTIEFYPGTASNSTVHDEDNGGTTRERQDFAMREYRTGYEAWRRTGTGSAFGIMGEFDRLRTDSPSSINAEKRSRFSVPRTSLVLSGKLPLLASQRVRYGLTFTHRYESRTDETRGLVSNAVGDYLDKDGVTLPTVESIIPTHYGIRSAGVRAGVLFRAASWLGIAGAYDYLSNTIEGRNDAQRNSSEIREDRPYGTFSASAQAKLAGHLRLVGDASKWSTGQTDQRWVASFSTGTGSPPVAGRGLYQRREEDGRELRGRASWIQGGLTLSAGGSTFHRQVTTHVPPVDDRTSFNYFINVLSTRQGADSLSLPDSVRANETTETGSEYGVGAALELPWRSARIGVEYHLASSTFEQQLSGSGPDRKVWDVHTGAELPLSGELVVRGGYIYRWLDNDELLAQNEFVSHSVTTGFSYLPRGASWAMDTGYLVRWGRADFGDPTRIRSSEQSGLFRIRWVF